MTLKLKTHNDATYFHSDLDTTFQKTKKQNMFFSYTCTKQEMSLTRLQPIHLVSLQHQPSLFDNSLCIGAPLAPQPVFTSQKISDEAQKVT